MTTTPTLQLSSPSDVPHQPTVLPVADQPISHMTTHSHTGSLKPKQFPGFKTFHTKYPLLSFHFVLHDIEPTCYSKAAPDPRWRAAMSTEFDALISNGTCTLFPRPPHRRVIHNKWVYKINMHANSSVDRFKARLVAKGFEQQSEVEYTKTFSPVTTSATIQLILALAIHFEYPIHQLDISNAFLHGSLNEEDYMDQTRGFVDPSHANFVCKLNKALYGLKQALCWLPIFFSTLASPCPLLTLPSLSLPKVVSNCSY
jgi:hypothetical protein